MKPKLRILNTGESTIIELDGKVIGKGVKKVAFSHDNGKSILSLDIDLSVFEFMDMDFDEVERSLKNTGH